MNQASAKKSKVENEDEPALHATEMLLSTVLRSGVLLSAMLVGIGAILHLLHGGTPSSTYHPFRRSPFITSRLHELIHGFETEPGRSLVQVGLLVLIATPVLRVALSIGVFLKQRDLTYVIVTLFVFVVLMFSLFA